MKVDRYETSQPKQLAIAYPISTNIEILDSLNFQEKDLIDFEMKTLKMKKI